MRVAIQGERGSFSHAAAREMLRSASILPCANSAEVFTAVALGEAQAAVIPIENTLAGPVTEHYDLLLRHELFIRREHLLRIEHCLIAAPGVTRKDLKTVYSHPVALAQCLGFFRAHPRVRPQPFYDTAGSVKHILEQRLRDAGAIAPAGAVAEYGGKVLQRGLEDNKKNFTRFFLIAPKRAIRRGSNKTSIAFALKNQAGALHGALAAFADRDISLSKIESRPVPGKPWEYVFYVDFLRGADRVAQAALRDLKAVASLVKVLGVYPAAGRARSG